MKNLASIWCGHDANVTFYNSTSNSYHIIELERLVKKRYFRLHVDNDLNTCDQILNNLVTIAKSDFGIDNDFEFVSSPSGGQIYFPQLIFKHFNTKNYISISNHHQSHAYAAFYQSPFDKAIIFSYDGGGDDGFFNIYKAEHNQISLIEKIDGDFGGMYMLLSSCVKEIVNSSINQLSLPGKLMGLCGYGTAIDEYVDDMVKLCFSKPDQINNFHILNKKHNLGIKTDSDPWKFILNNGTFEKQAGYNFAATIQAAFEKSFFIIFKRIMKNYPDYPVCITGGAALNVLVNQKIKDNYDHDIFVPPNPNDCGLSLGELLVYQKPKNKISVTYSGLPIIDRCNLKKNITQRNAQKINISDLAKILKDGKIVGVCHGNSEVGPRSLGNRSIICDPSYPNMKDILNSKVKFREWYRPFAPFCKKEEAHLYFESKNFDNMEFMGFAPKVREDKKHELPSITHVDGTSRLQTVTKESHLFFYDLLTEFGKISKNNVLLNTSFNIRGLPILSSIEDALYVLDNTQIDYLLIENYLFKK